MKIKLFTIGFTQKTAQDFFESLAKVGVKKVIDTRVNNTSQLAGFAKKKDLQYFLKSLSAIDYDHALSLAPTKDLLSRYRKQEISWEDYEKGFYQLISDRAIENQLSPDSLDSTCLLCSEAKPHYCHRRLVAEYLQNKWGNVEICHL
jgi:uncharacterized protein (DUF488 family)